MSPARHEFLVETKTWLRPSTLRVLHAFAVEHHTTVDAVLSKIADRAVEASTPQPARRQWTRVTDEHIRRAAELYKAGKLWREIAEEIGVTTKTLQNHRARIVNEGVRS